MDDDQRAALVGYLLMRPVVERIELCPRFNRRVASASLIMRMFSWGSWPLE